MQAAGPDNATMVCMTSAMSKQKDRLKCAVVGVGRMGRHHARVYAQRDDVDFLGVLDTDHTRATDIIEQWGGKAFDSLEQLIEAGVSAVTIATPTVYHAEAVEPLLQAGVACLVEKPLAPDVDQAQRIADTARRTETLLQVGHIVRFDPVMVAMQKLHLKPRFVEVNRISPMTFRSVDVSVVHDMMIHDIDVLLMLVGAEPQEISASAVSVISEAEDVCNARLTFPPYDDGMCCVANVTASRLALKTERKMRVICDDIYVSADFVARGGTVVHKTENIARLEEVRQRLRAGEDLSSVNYLDFVEVDSLEVDDVEPLGLEIDAFLDAVRTGRRPAVDAEAGLAAVRTAERIIDSARAAGARMV